MCLITPPTRPSGCPVCDAVRLGINESIQVVRYAQQLFEEGDLHKGIRPKSFDQRAMPCLTATTTTAI